MKEPVCVIRSTMTFMPLATKAGRQSGGTRKTRASPASAGGNSSRLAPLHSRALPNAATSLLASPHGL